MTLEQKLLELMAEDGPNIPMRTLAIYCGVNQSTISRFVRGQLGVSEATRAQIEKGLREYAQLISEIANN